ncbi:MAG: hypothetical protein KDD44_01200 [Bdellovibrionales bacterium]|nr:hypothetical protein [Bdellovibrionales bacterium]
MTSERAAEVWDSIISTLEDKLQYALIEQARSVVKADFEGGELSLLVADQEACDFFNSPVNEQRLILQCRSVVHIQKVRAKVVDASPLRR